MGKLSTARSDALVAVLACLGATLAACTAPEPGVHGGASKMAEPCATGAPLHLVFDLDGVLFRNETKRSADDGLGDEIFSVYWDAKGEIHGVPPGDFRGQRFVLSPPSGESSDGADERSIGEGSGRALSDVPSAPRLGMRLLPGAQALLQLAKARDDLSVSFYSAQAEWRNSSLLDAAQVDAQTSFADLARQSQEKYGLPKKNMLSREDTRSTQRQEFSQNINGKKSLARAGFDPRRTVLIDDGIQNAATPGEFYNLIRVVPGERAIPLVFSPVRAAVFGGELGAEEDLDSRVLREIRSDWLRIHRLVPIAGMVDYLSEALAAGGNVQEVVREAYAAFDSGASDGWPSVDAAEDTFWGVEPAILFSPDVLHNKFAAKLFARGAKLLSDAAGFQLWMPPQLEALSTYRDALKEVGFTDGDFLRFTTFKELGAYYATHY